MTDLPFIDEHSLACTAPARQVWTALLEVLRRSRGAFALMARVLGCDPPVGSARFDARPGEAVPGFRVAAAEIGHRLVLTGRHRFAIYELTFLLDGTHLRARSRALFPGFRGRLYRALVIGSGGHGFITRRMLRTVCRLAGRFGEQE